MSNVRPIENRGGAREGAGKPKGRRDGLDVSTQERKALITAARRLKTETGKSLGDYLMRIITDAKLDRDKLTAIRIYYDVVAGQIKETRTTKVSGPQIMLPPEDQ